MVKKVNQPQSNDFEEQKPTTRGNQVSSKGKILLPADREKISNYLYQQTIKNNPHLLRDESQWLPNPKPNKLFETFRSSKKQITQLNLKSEVLSVLCGTVFGDSSLTINKGYKNARLSARHSTQQSSWVLWKYCFALKQFFTSPVNLYIYPPDGFQPNIGLSKVIGTNNVTIGDMPLEKFVGKIKIASKSLPVLTQLLSLVSDNGKKAIKHSWINHMDSYFLMTLWLDDGLLANQKSGVFCINTTPKAEQEILCDWLSKAYDIEAFVQPTEDLIGGLPAYRVRIKNLESLEKMLEVIAPLIPVKEMLYKVFLVPPSNDVLLQRWASKLKQLVRTEFHNVIAEHYDPIFKERGIPVTFKQL